MANASDLKKGVSFLHSDTAYRVTKKENVTVGTHSHTKLKVYARPLLGGGEKVFTFAHTDNVDTVDIIKKLGQVVSKSEDLLQVMDSRSYDMFDAAVDEALLEELTEGDNVIFVDYPETTVLEKAN